MRGLSLRDSGRGGNRPDEIKDALVSRPGRADKAIEIVDPDTARRGRLVALYGVSLECEEGAIDEALALSGGRSAAFVKETARLLAQSFSFAGRDDMVDRATISDVLGEAAGSANRIGRRITGPSNTFKLTERAGVPVPDGCGEDL